MHHLFSGCRKLLQEARFVTVSHATGGGGAAKGSGPPSRPVRGDRDHSGKGLSILLPKIISSSTKKPTAARQCQTPASIPPVWALPFNPEECVRRELAFTMSGACRGAEVPPR